MLHSTPKDIQHKFSYAPAKIENLLVVLYINIIIIHNCWIISCRITIKSLCELDKLLNYIVRWYSIVIIIINKWKEWWPGEQVFFSLKSWFCIIWRLFLLIVLFSPWIVNPITNFGVSDTTWPIYSAYFLFFRVPGNDTLMEQQI